MTTTTTTTSTTEADSLYNDLENKSVKELLLSIHEEDKKVLPAVHNAIPQIEKLVEEIYQRMKKGGRLVLSGCRNQRATWYSGRIGKFPRHLELVTIWLLG